jgi:hypothetical protein
VGLTAKTHAAGSPVTGFGVQLGAVDEGGHHFILRLALDSTYCANDSAAFRSTLGSCPHHDDYPRH